MSSLDDLIKLGIEMDAGAVKAIIRKKDGTPLRVFCVYFESDELKAFLVALEQLEEEFGFGV